MSDEYDDEESWFLLSRLSSGAVMIAHPGGKCLTLSRDEYAELIARAEKHAMATVFGGETKSQPL